MVEKCMSQGNSSFLIRLSRPGGFPNVKMLCLFLGVISAVIRCCYIERATSKNQESLWGFPRVPYINTHKNYKIKIVQFRAVFTKLSVWKLWRKTKSGKWRCNRDLIGPAGSLCGYQSLEKKFLKATACRITGLVGKMYFNTCSGETVNLSKIY